MIHLYGIIISLAIGVCVYLAETQAKKDNKNLDQYWGYVLVSLIGGILGARFYHVISEWKYYSNNLTGILQVYNGGISIFGAILFGMIFGYIYTNKKNISTKYYWALTAWVMPLGQSIGRLANYINQELYGTPTTLPWAITIPLEKRFLGYETIATYHPLFLYEAILNVALFAFLTKKILRYRTIQGIENKIIGTYFLGYGLIRFLLEFLKINPWRIYNINVAQMITLIFIICGIYILRKHKV